MRILVNHATSVRWLMIGPRPSADAHAHGLVTAQKVMSAILIKIFTCNSSGTVYTKIDLACTIMHTAIF